MSNNTQKSTGAVQAILLLGLLLATGSASASVYHDVVAWWHFDYDPNGDAIAQADEIRDQREWGTAAQRGPGGRHATTTTGILGAPQWTPSAAIRPAGGQDYGRRSMRFAPAVDGSDNVWPDTFRVNGLGLAGSATLVTRFRWDGQATPVERSNWLYNNHLEWNAFRGWLFGVSVDPYPRLAFYMQRHTSMMEVAITNGVWYDIALVVTDHGTNSVGTVDFYLWPAGGALTHRRHNNPAITNSISPNPMTTIGSENHVNSYGAGNNRKSFRGELNHLAVWNRALTFAEINEAFGNPQPLFQVGIRNHRSDDMRIEAEGHALYGPGDPWHMKRRAVTTGMPTSTIKLPVTAAQAALDYVFHLRTDVTQNSQTADLRLIVNNTTNATQTVGPSQDVFWYVTGGTLTSGVNDVVIQHVAGPAVYCSFDWMELAGAWQVGIEDNSPSEFELEGLVPADFFVTNPNWKHARRALSTGTTNFNVNFSLSAELARKYFFSYTTRIISQGGSGASQHAFSVDLNDTPLARFAPVPNGTYITLPLPRETIRPGNNRVRIRFDETHTGWLQFDFHRLEVAEPRKGTLMLLR